MENIVDLTNFEEIPVVPLRGLVVYPHTTLHFDVGRKKSIKALDAAMENNQLIFLASQKDSGIEDPNVDEINDIGVICKIKQMIKLPTNKSIQRVIVEGVERAQVVAMYAENDYFKAVVDKFPKYDIEVTPEISAYVRAVKKEYESYASMFKRISNEVVSKIIGSDDIDELSDFICENSFFSFTDKQEMLEEANPYERIKKLLVLLKKETASLEIEAEIQEKLQSEIDKNQREYYLREEMKVISNELGEGENPVEEADEYRQKIEKLNCSDEIKDKLFNECSKLAKIPAGSHEGTVVRTYLDKCLQIPFGKYSKDRISLEKSRRILDADHYGLDKVKDRIIESLAVLKRSPEYNGQIICLYGPPGVGKTSIVKSLATSMNRKYVRIALGGVHDEAEIRGHRRTYIGAMAGRIVEAIISAGTMNPIILLDEIDKVGADYKGDPSSALLEALDPEQNSTFNDHYIDFPIDLSKVLFITTANDVSTINAPLYDRMEVIELNSYSVEEKFNIAKNHLVKKEMKKHNLNRREFKISNDAIYKIIECYTREAGVRKLEKEISTLCRKASISLEQGAKSFKVTADNITEYLGVEKYNKDIISNEDLVGTVTGLAWTQVGGTILPIEVSALDGTGKIEITGNLGDVMKESAKTAVSYVRSKTMEYGIDNDFYKTKDIHIHAPEAAIPKDGPSAGLAITTAIVSELTGTPIKHNVAMTGEISLKGKAMAIGGLKEKSMAAYKAGCDTVIIPEDNVKDLAEISAEVKESVTFKAVKCFDEVIEIALQYPINQNKNVVITTTQNNQQTVTQ